MTDDNLQKNRSKIAGIKKTLASNDLVSGQQGVSVKDWLDSLQDDFEFFSQEENSQTIEAKLFFALFERIEVGDLEKIKINFSMASAFLLYYLPADTPTSFVEWKEKFISGELNWPANMRFLGQAFFSGDYEVCLQLIDLGDYLDLDEFLLSDDENYYFCLAVFFIIWKRLDSLDKKNRTNIIGKYLWLAIKFGIDTKVSLENILAEEPDLTAYLANSGLWAEGIKNSKTLLTNGNTVGKFIEDFLAFAKKDDLNLNIQKKYLDELKIKNIWDEKTRDNVQELLQIYLHLRECDLFDYRGLLSDSGAKEDKYEWAKIINNSITLHDREEIKRYLTLLHRPWRTKMQIITALESINWKDENILNQALILNEIFEEIYGHFYGPFIYFDQEKGDWFLNKNFPDFLHKEKLNYAA